MGCSIPTILNSVNIFKGWNEEVYSVLMCGLDASGKTSILYQMKIGKLVNCVPTVGFNVERLQFNGCKVDIWDVGGGCKIKQIEYHYYQQKAGYIFVIDLSDRQRYPQVLEYLKRSIYHKQMPKEIPLLIYANKTDLKTIEPTQIEQMLNKQKQQLNRPYHVQPCCAKTGQGLLQGFQWISNVIKKQRKLRK